MATSSTRKTAAKKTTAARSATTRAAKAPADRKAPKAEQDNTIQVELRGETWTVDKEVLDDFELLDDLNALDQREDPTRMPSVLRRFLGDEQFSKAMALLRAESKTGRVTIEAGSEFVWDLIGALNPNSQRS